MKTITLNISVAIKNEAELTPEEQHLLHEAQQATYRSYAPYSHFRVGAAVRLANGVELSGSNQENAAYPSGLCAERTTLFYAGAQYPDEPVRMLAIAARGTDGELTFEPTGPCGACRQFLAEFSPEMEVLCAKAGNRYVSYKLSELLPHTFNF